MHESRDFFLFFERKNHESFGPLFGINRETDLSDYLTTRLMFPVTPDVPSLLLVLLRGYEQCTDSERQPRPTRAPAAAP